MTTPEKIGRYEIKGELGRGGMATVYRAYDPSFEREVAIKVLPRELMHDPQFRDRFRREIKTIASLEHPAIVPVYDVGEEDGVPYFVMRYMPGGSLTQWIEKGKFSLEDAARIIERLSSALAYAHKVGLIHRDLKPDNILFDNNGDPFISDFGVAKITDSSTNMTGSGIIGTPAYMSPEQAQGEKVDNRSDIYGLGVIIFQMLSGHQPYEATTPMGVAVKHITDPVPEILKDNPNLPGQTDVIIKTAMAKDPSLRYQTATELAQALSEAAFGKREAMRGGATVAPASAKAAPSAARSGSSRGLLIGGIVLLLLLVAGGAAFAMSRGMLSPAPPPTATAAPATATSEAPTAALEPTVAATTGPVLAPVCAPGVISPIVTPDIKETNQYCVSKRAVTEYTIPLGATFTSQRAGFTCDLKTQQGDRQVIACFGPENLTKFTLQVCIPEPTPSTSAVVGACSAGTVYDYDHACCTQPKPADAGCITYEVSLRACG
ncbi:MAG TPA: serine/threonine-protein kinase [Anaerolineales bacterium]|nr:serine/threonine-protein kinase [Anaerolineales bacterium]